MGRVDPVYLPRLAGRKPLGRAEAPDAVETALPAQHSVAAADAAGEIVGDVEDGGVAAVAARVEVQTDQ